MRKTLLIILLGTLSSCFFAEKLTGYEQQKQSPIQAIQAIEDNANRVAENPYDYKSWIALVIALCTTGYLVYGKVQAWRSRRQAQPQAQPQPQTANVNSQSDILHDVLKVFSKNDIRR